MRRSPTSLRRRRIRLVLTTALVAVIAVPAVAATCYDMSGSGMMAGQRTMIELAKGEVGGIDCKQNKIKTILTSGNGMLFTCE